MLGLLGLLTQNSGALHLLVLVIKPRAAHMLSTVLLLCYTLALYKRLELKYLQISRATINSSPIYTFESISLFYTE